ETFAHATVDGRPRLDRDFASTDHGSIRVSPTLRRTKWLLRTRVIRNGPRAARSMRALSPKYLDRLGFGSVRHAFQCKYGFAFTASQPCACRFACYRFHAPSANRPDCSP